MNEPMIHSPIGSMTLYATDGVARKTAYPLKCRCQQCYFNFTTNWCLAYNKIIQPFDTCVDGLKINLE